MKTKYFLGQRVQCINPTGYLVEGMTYTVRAVHNNGADITVEECYTKSGYQAYKGSRFTPLEFQVSLSLGDIEDIKIAHSLLTFLKDNLDEVDNLGDVLANIQLQQQQR